MQIIIYKTFNNEVDMVLKLLFNSFELEMHNFHHKNISIANRKQRKKRDIALDYIQSTSS